MEAKVKVELLSLEPYRHLFPPASGVDSTVKLGANVSDTVNFIPEIVRRTSWQVEKYVAQELRGLPIYDACKKLWHFVKYHIEYTPDERGIEQVRSPRRLIADAKGDCDCGTTFIDTCLHRLNLKALGVKEIVNRITKYKKDYFQHIYPVVFLENGKKIIMDFVVGEFDYEEPYTEKKDYPMELQFLDGIEGSKEPVSQNSDERVYDNKAAFGELGKLLKRGNSGGGSSGKKAGIFKKKTPEQKQAKKEKRKAIGKKVLKVVNKINKINPATVLLRAGILASMKLNVGKIAERIKWGYASPELAESKGMDMSKYGKVKNVLAKTEQIFFAAGGKPENLKKSILTGHGNRNHEVAGLEGLNENTILSQLLGAIYQDEFISGMEGFEGFEGLEGYDGLGEPATAASIAAASTAMGTLAALLKSIGDLFPKKKNTGEQAATAENAEPEPSVETSNEAPAESSEPAPAEKEEEPAAPASEDQEVTPTEEVTEEEPQNTESEEEVSGIFTAPILGLKTFYQGNKNWVLPTLAIGGGIAAVCLIKHFVDKSSEDKPSQIKKQYALNGTGKKRGRKPGSKNKSPSEKVSAMALM